MNLARILPAAAMVPPRILLRAPAAATAPARRRRRRQTATAGWLAASTSPATGRDDTGAYTVTFTNAAVSDTCAYTASIGDSGTEVSTPRSDQRRCGRERNDPGSDLRQRHGNAADRGLPPLRGVPRRTIAAADGDSSSGSFRGR